MPIRRRGSTSNIIPGATMGLSADVGAGIDAFKAPPSFRSRRHKITGEMEEVARHLRQGQVAPQQALGRIRDLEKTLDKLSKKRKKK